MKTLRGKRVLVTGASGNVGRTLVEAFVAVGAHVIGTARRRTGLDDLRAGLGQHDRLEVAECDVTDASGVQALFDAVHRKGPLDAVIHAVGSFDSGPAVDTLPATVERLINTNYLSTTLVVTTALQKMQAQGHGAIVVITSEAAETPTAGLAAYGSSKAAATHFVQACALEAERHEIRVNALLPGIIDTEANRAAMPSADRKRWITPLAIAQSCILLCGDDAGAVRGAAIRLGGG